MKRLLSNLALLLGVSVIVAPVAMTQTTNPYVLTATKIATALGYTPADSSLYCALAGCTMVGDFKFTDATYDIGKAGATRPRNIFASGTVQLGSGSTLSSSGDGILQLANSSVGILTRLRLGPSSASVPALTPSGSTLKFRLADESGDAPITAGAGTFSGQLTIAGSSTPVFASTAAMNNAAGAQVGTLTNAPTTGNPTKWIFINDNGTSRAIPTW